MRTLQRRLVTPEKKMRELLAGIYEHSASAKARDLAGTLMEQHEETFSGVYGNAGRARQKWRGGVFAHPATPDPQRGDLPPC